MVKSHIISQLNHENNGLFHSIQLKHTTSYQPFCSRWGLFFLFIPCASWLAGWSFPASWWVRKGPQPILLPISRGHVTISICGVSLDSKETYHLVGTEIIALSMENLENLGKILGQPMDVGAYHGKSIHLVGGDWNMNGLWLSRNSWEWCDIPNCYSLHHFSEGLVETTNQ